MAANGAKAAAATKGEEPKVETPKKEEPKKEEPKVEAEAKEETGEKDAQMKGEKVEEEVKEVKEPEKPKEAEKPKELEENSQDDPRAKLSEGAVALNMADATLNAMSMAKGKLLMTLTEGGFEHLLASVRANVGMKTGRYMFEVKIVESLGTSEAKGGQGLTPQPHQLLRVGFSLAGSSLFLSDGPDNVCFDSLGFFVHEKSRKKVSQKIIHDQTVAVLLNLDESSPNVNTVSLFRDGVRISEPQAIPECLRGKVLYPTITYRNLTLQVNFGPAAQTPLPFTCRMLAEAAKADVEVAAASQPAGGRHEVLFPVGLPEQGYFDWVDDFLAKNPGYTELSDRKILEWAVKSGLWKKGAPVSNDKPEAKFGIPGMDDKSVQRILAAVAPTSPRSFVIPELKANLLAKDRKEALLRFSAPEFKKTATVIMGEPSEEYKAKVHALILAEKRTKAEQERKKKAQEEERKRLFEEKKRKAEESKKAREAALKRKKEGKDEEKKEDEAKEEEKKEEEEPKVEEEEVAVELTEEEKGLWYRKVTTKDLTERALSQSYANFSLPNEDEGFEGVSYAWQPESACAKAVKDWVLQMKLTQRVEDLQPGDWFKKEWAAWQKVLSEWKRRQNEWKDPAKRKAYIAKKKAELKKKKAEEEKGEGDEAAKEGEEKAAKEKEGEVQLPEIDADDLDVFSVEDVADLGNGEPLFAHFVYEDWTLLSTRYELHLLLCAFKQDLDDSDRPSFTESHLAFYYNKYFKKPFSVKSYGVEKLSGVVDLVKDTLAIDEKSSFLQTAHAEDTPHPNFMKLTEQHRRERARRFDAGDETAKLTFTRVAAQPPRQPPAVGSRPPQPQAQRPGSGAPYSGSGGPYGAQKRPYVPPAAPAYSSKQPRTAYSGSAYSAGASGSWRR